jgi:CMP-N-acetylneuraminic acid synthetase
MLLDSMKSDKKNVFAIITARSGSKGVVGKNLRILGDKPLIQHSFDVAVQSNVFDKIVLTTDSDEAIHLAKSYQGQIDVPYKRPEFLSSDIASQVDVITHVLSHYTDKGEKPDYFVLLQPTCPFRTTTELKRGVDLLLSGYDTVIGATQVMHHPVDYFSVSTDGKIDFLMKNMLNKRRQEFPTFYFNNGGFYGCSTDFFLETKMFYNADSAILEMNEHSLIDIDTELDFKFAQFIYNENGN